MAKPITRQRIAWILAALAGIAVLVIAVWIAVAGPITVFRIMRYGDTNIDDFSHYPGRDLRPSDQPFHFAESEEELRIPSASLDDHGGDADLESLLESNDTIAFLVIKDDAILFERYFQSHRRSSISQLFSVSKSVTSALIGMAIDDGYLQGENQPITELIPELAQSGFGEVRIRHLLTMMSGSSYVENDHPFREHVILNFTPELEREILQVGMADSPGEVFRYKSGDNALLGLALDRALGEETITEYAQRRLWDPLGMEDGGVWTIDSEGNGLEKTWCCLAASARDLAKFGRLYLNNGGWDGQQILSEDWIKRSTQMGQVPLEAWPPEFREIGWWNYGYQWWLASEQQGDYFAQGKDGQILYVSPERRLIIVRLGWSQGELRTSQWISLFQGIADQAGEDS